MLQEGEREGQLLGRTQRYLLELSTILYFVAKNSAIPLIQQYVYFLVDQKYNFTDIKHTILSEYEQSVEHNTSTTDPEVLDTIEELRLLAHRVNEESSLIVLYLNIAELLPASVVVLFLGAYSDYSGKRKFLMWLPCVGNTLYALGFLLPLYICNGDIDHPATKTLFVLASICSGLSGTVPGFLSGNASYISDTDTPERRTLRLAIVELSIGLTFGCTTLANGFWINATSNFEQPLWFVVACSIVPLIILICFLKEPNGEITQKGPSTFENFKGIRNVFGFKSISQKKLWAIFFAFQIYVFVQQGQERTFVLYLQNAPLYWNSIQIGIFVFVLYVLSGLGSWPGVPMLHRCCDDVSIAMLAFISKGLGSVLLAFAKEDILIYASSVVQIFHLTPYAVARSLASKQVGEDEQGSVYALIHSVQSVVSFLGPVAHNAVFTATLRSMSGLIFLISGPLLIIPLLLLIFTKYLDRTDGGYSSMDGSNTPRPITPSGMTPMSDTATLVQHPEESMPIH